MVVLGIGKYDAPLAAWKKVRKRYDVRRGHGKCAAWRFNKQSFMPPDMYVHMPAVDGRSVMSFLPVSHRLINVVYESPDHAPVVGKNPNPYSTDP